MKIEPLYHRILVKPQEPEKFTESGLTIPASALGKSCEGIVVEHGPGRLLASGETHPMSVKVGDRVMYAKHAGMEVKFEGTEHLMLAEEEVLAILRD